MNLIRIASALEGVSLLVLLCVAMPLKYIWATPQAVTVVGMIHGVLSLWLISLAAQGRIEGRWSTARALWMVVLASLPLGWLAVDRWLRAQAPNEPTG